MIKLTIYELPIGKGRPKFSRAGGFVRAYTPKRTRDYQQLVADCFKENYPNHKPYEGALRIDAIFYMKIPKGTSKKKRQLMLENKIKHKKKPDKDNLEKAVTDPLNKLAYIDDSQIVESHVYKKYGEIPRTEIIITPLEDEV